jgi:hypothetical protein
LPLTKADWIGPSVTEASSRRGQLSLVFVYLTSVNIKCCILPTPDAAICGLQYCFGAKMNERKTMKSLSLSILLVL